MNIFDSAKERLLIVAHRGSAAGNIPCNTIAAYQVALAQGADMIEVDANMGKVGTLYSFHPYMERSHLNKDCFIPDMTDEEIAQLRYVNCDRTPTQFGIAKLEDIFELCKNKCYINIDKFWLYPREICDMIRRFNMADQIIVKTSPDEKMFDLMEEVFPEIAYLPVIRQDNGLHDELLRRRINYVGAEVLFEREDDEVGTPAYIDKLHRDGKLVWANSIIYDHRTQLVAGHNDDISAAGDPENGWGWLADRGFDLIQTDWPLMLRLYLEETGRRFKK
ncbi:MAG: glycerophosphodiester phosphodiesterase family protein [Ruminococcaceae bacterium]|nr:glycerophosphodiester phosphodiesterase family protein [Oscillospiraceae bacterium]